LPELPEVETIRRTLEAMVLGKRIEDVEVRWGKIIKEPDDAELFCLFLKGQTIREIGRRGKFLMIIVSYPICVWKGNTDFLTRAKRWISILMSYSNSQTVPS